MEIELANTEHLARSLQFIAKSSISWPIWKETEPELFWLFERLYAAWNCRIRFTGEVNIYLVEVELSAVHVPKLEKALKEGIISIEIDKIHGIDPAMAPPDVRISRIAVSLAPARPQNADARKTVESLELRLLELETQERSRSIDLRMIMNRIQDFQVQVLGRLSLLESTVSAQMEGLTFKCDKMEKVVAKYTSH